MIDNRHATLTMERVSLGSPTNSASQCPQSTVNLSVARGSFHGVFGQAHCGKTALAEIAVGLRTPRSGSVALFGKSGRLHRSNNLRYIGYQPQLQSFFPRLTLIEHLRTVAGMQGTSDRRIKTVIEALLLDDFVNERIEALAPRELKLLGIATAVAHAPALLVLDEPTFGLDTHDRHSVLALLRSSNIGSMTTLFFTRHLDEVERLCDSATLLGVEDGTAEASGTQTMQRNSRPTASPLAHHYGQERQAS